MWLANRALHPFGYALSVAVETNEAGTLGEIVEERGIRVMRTTDPLGIVFDDEDDARRRFFGWLKRRLSG